MSILCVLTPKIKPVKPGFPGTRVPELHSLCVRFEELAQVLGD